MRNRWLRQSDFSSEGYVPYERDNIMSCQVAQTVSFPYLNDDPSLSLELREAFESHLLICSTCAGARGEQVALWNAQAARHDQREHQEAAPWRSVRGRWVKRRRLLLRKALPSNDGRRRLGRPETPLPQLGRGLPTAGRTGQTPQAVLADRHSRGCREHHSTCPGTHHCV